MKYETNKFGNPVVYIANYEYSDQYSNDNYFHAAYPTLAEAEVNDGGYIRVYEFDLITGKQTSIKYLNDQSKLKDALIRLYKNGIKKAAYKKLDIYKDFAAQVTFDCDKDVRHACELVYKQSIASEVNAKILAEQTKLAKLETANVKGWTPVATRNRTRYQNVIKKLEEKL
jgi:hypothetical protein